MRATNIQEMRKQLKKATDKANSDSKNISEPVKRKTKTKTVTQINKTRDEDIVIREFLSRIVDLEEYERYIEVNTFVKNSSTSIQYVVELLFDKLPERFLKSFIEEYLGQTDENVFDFYKSFIDKPDIKKLFYDKLDVDDYVEPPVNTERAIIVRTHEDKPKIDLSKVVHKVNLQSPPSPIEIVDVVDIDLKTGKHQLKTPPSPKTYSYPKEKPLKQPVSEKDKKSRVHQINRLLSGKITTRVEDIASINLSTTLLNISPEVLDYEKDSEYIIEVVNSATAKTAKELFEKIATIDVYINAGQNIRQKNVFTERIKQLYYLPEMLLNLTPPEMLPEVFDDPRVSLQEKRKLTVHIQEKIKTNVRNLGNSLYNSLNSTESQPTLPHTIVPQISVKIHEWKNICKNHDDIVSIPDNQLIYYEEIDEDSKDIYCLHIPSILEQGHDFTNPYSGKKLSSEFMTRLLNIYKKQPVYLSPDSIPSSPNSTTSPELAPGLLDILRKNISELKNEMENEQSDVSSVSSSSESSSSSSQSSAGSEDEKGSTIKNSSFINDSPHSSFIGDDSKCAKCGKNTDGSLKSIIYNNKGLREVQFCSFTCFENTESKDWPKHSKKSKKNNK
jgi:hypothetical protein